MTGLQSWLDTLGPYATVLFGVVNLYLLLRTSRNVQKLETNTNSIQEALNRAKVSEGRVLERDDQRERERGGTP